MTKLEEALKYMENLRDGYYDAMEGRDYTEFLFWEDMFLAAHTICKGILLEINKEGIFKEEGELEL